MQEDDETTGPTVDVMEAGGHRIFLARQLVSGNWLLIEKNGASRQTVSAASFAARFERIPTPFKEKP